MLMKILLWAILIGSVIMGYFGYQSGSAANAALGIGVLLLVAFTLFFLIKLFLGFGFVVVKIILFVGLFALIAISGLKGCQYLMGQGRQANQEQPAQAQSFAQETAQQGFLERAVSFFSLSKNGAQTANKELIGQAQDNRQKLAPPLPPKISGRVDEVRSGYLFRIGKHFIKLYGIDSPDLKQTCLDKRGDSYACGRKTKMMLERLVLHKHVQCQIAGGDYQGNYIATCKVGSYDIGASLLKSGWGVADRAVSSVYIPYEGEAHRSKKGLWAGRFVAPWQARHHRTQTDTAKQKKGFWESLF